VAIQESRTPTPAACGVPRYGSRQADGSWIAASPFGLLAMTERKDPGLTVTSERNARFQIQGLCWNRGQRKVWNDGRGAKESVVCGERRRGVSA
jgi:hypothetical protein